MPSITEHLNDLVMKGERDPNFRIMCCSRWRDFRDGDGIADDLADYAREVFAQGLLPEQDAAIRAFPTEPLRLLRRVVILGLDCPNGPPDVDPPRIPPITLRFEAERSSEEPPAIRVDLSAENLALVTFRAAKIV